MRQPDSPRRVGVPLVAVAVASVAAAWVWLAGNETAGLVRSGFSAFGAVEALEAGLALVVAGVGWRLLPDGTRDRALAWLAARRGRIRPNVPSTVVLTVIVAVVAAVRASLGASNHTPKVLGDELIYSGLAKGWAFHGEPLLRGSLDVGQSTLYPLLLAPVYRLASDGAAAHRAVLVTQAIVIALTAVPVYVLGRRILSRPWALGAAALSVLVPWTAYAALTMTESLFYPVFATYAAVLAWALERPSARRQITLLAMLAVLVGVRAQGVGIAFGTLVAILVFGAAHDGVKRAFTRFRLTFAVFAVLTLLGVAAAAAGIAVPTSSYNVLVDSLGRAVGMLKWGAWNLGELQFPLGVTALAALPVALAGMLRRSASVPVRAVAAVTVGVGLSLLASVALLSASPYGLGVMHERSLFYVTPLVLLCLARWLQGGLERPFWLSAASAAGCLALAVVLPQRLVLDSTNNVDVPSSAFFVTLHSEAPSVPFRVWAILIAAAGAGTFLFARRALFPILTVVLAFAAVTAQVDYRDTFTDAQARSLAWVDHALPGGGRADVVYLGLPDSDAFGGSDATAALQSLTIWTEFFNNRVDGVQHVYRSNPRDGLASPRLTIASPGHRVLSDARPFAPEYVVVDSRQRIVGKRLATFRLARIGSPYRRVSLSLWRVEPPLRFAAPLALSLIPPPAPSHVGYCLRGVFVQLLKGQPKHDPKFKDAVIANYVDGQGITCAAPPSGYVHRGFAPSSLGVPSGTYPYFAP